jgi:hypothetical protein
MDQWLLRTSKNRVSGPFPKEEICQMILQGKLTHQDEICMANGYWIYIHEYDEVRKYLGIDVPRVADPGDDEITGTERTEMEPTKKLDLDEVTPEAMASPAETEASLEGDFELDTDSLKDTGEDIGEDTGITTMSSSEQLEALRRKRKAALKKNSISSSTSGGSGSISSLGSGERSNLTSDDFSHSVLLGSARSPLTRKYHVRGSSKRMVGGFFWKSLGWFLMAGAGILMILVSRLLQH